jgi:hypothetical protein
MEWSLYWIKIALTAALIVVISEIAKRNALMASLIGSLPLVSVIGMLWMFGETGDVSKITKYSTGMFWYVLPSLPMFLILPWLMQKGWGFHLALLLCVFVTAGLYFIMTRVLAKYGMIL